MKLNLFIFTLVCFCLKCDPETLFSFLTFLCFLENIFMKFPLKSEFNFIAPRGVKNAPESIFLLCFFRRCIGSGRTLTGALAAVHYYGAQYALYEQITALFGAI